MLRSLHLLSLMLVFPVAIEAQEAASIGGIVIDTTKAVIPHAQVSVTLGSDQHSSFSGPDGRYSVGGIQEGTYRMSVQAPGFAPFTRESLRAVRGKRVTIIVTLQPASTQTSLTVAADNHALSLDADANASARVISGKDLDALEENPDALQSELSALAGPAAGMNGAELYIDGFSGGQIPPKAAIREIRINQNPLSAEFDRLGYGRIEISTKAGTEKTTAHIGASYLNSHLNTANPLATDQPSYEFYWIRGDIGGPVTKRSSYFINVFDFQRENQAIVHAVDPNEVTSTLAEAYPAPSSLFTTNLRTDLQIGQNHTFTIKDLIYRTTQSGSGVGSLNLPDQAQTIQDWENTLQIKDVFTKGPRFLNEASARWWRIHQSAVSLSARPSLTVQGAFTSGGANAGASEDHQDLVELQNYSTASLGAHTLRFGVRLRSYREGSFTTAGANGAYQFESVADYLNGTPYQYTGTIISNPSVHTLLFDGAAFFQDEWRVTPTFNLSLGLRMEGQNHIHDPINFAPRAAISWSPQRRGKSSAATVYRAGYGWFYDRFTVPNQIGGLRGSACSTVRASASVPAVSPAPPACCTRLYPGSKRMITRREFVQGAAATSVLTHSLGTAVAAYAEVEEPWFDRPMRWAQINMTEDDPAKMNVPFWLDYFKRIHADAVCLSAGGVVAFYPTSIPFHHRSRWLPGHETFLADLIEGCRRQGMIVVARTDPHATYQDAYEAHPEWIAVDAQGQKRPHPDYPNMWLTCALGPYNFDFMTQVTREVVTQFSVGGVFSNRWTGSGTCYCDNCKKLFFDAYHHDIPIHKDPRDAAYRDYVVWEQERLFALWDVWDKAIVQARPGARYIANSGGGATSGLDMKKVGELAPTLFADRQCRSGDMAPWANGKNGKEYRATLGNKAIGGIFHVGIVAPYRWMNSVKSPQETRLWVQDGMANGLRPWFNMVSGSVHDKRGLKVIEDLYVWHHKWEPYFRNTEPIARVGMMYSQQTADFHAGPQLTERLVEQPTNGMYQALIEARIPFEMVHEKLLDASRIDRYKLLLLPNIAALSDAQCQQLRDYVKRGGSLLATYETSLYDEHGNKRGNFALSDLFGATYVAHVNTEKALQNTYIRVGRDHSPLLRGMNDAEILMGGTWQITTKPSESHTDVPLTRIPAVANLPMEKTFWTVEDTSEPEVYMQTHGAGRVVYFPWDLDRLVWEVMDLDHTLLLRNAIEWAANEPAPLRSQGAGLFDVTAWRQKNSMTIHLVNLTNAMAMRPNIHELIPSQPQHVELDLPIGARALKARTLMKEGTLNVQQAGRTVAFTIPTVLDYEVIAIDLAAATGHA